MTKLAHPSPCRAKLDGLYIIPEGLLNAWQIVADVAGGYRGHRSLARHVQANLTCLCAQEGWAAYCGTYGSDRAPGLWFTRRIVDRWLDEMGGRAWIVAEMEARAAKRVVLFPGRRT